MVLFRVLNLSITVLIFTQCTGDNQYNETNKVDTKNEIVRLDEFEEFSLAPFGISALIYLPNEKTSTGNTETPRVDHEPDGFNWDLFLGQHFRLRIEDWGDTEIIALHKKELENSSNIYDVEFLEITDDFLYYTQTANVVGKREEGGGKVDRPLSYHCYGQHTINGINYVFRTNDNGHQKPIAECIAKSIKSVIEIIP